MLKLRNCILRNQISQYRKYTSEIVASAIPSVKQIPLLKNIIPVELMLRGGGEKLHEFIDDRHKLLGPIFREQLGPITSIFLCDADDIRKIFACEGKYPKHVLPESWLLYNEVKNCKRGLYFMNGEEWFECRKVLNRILLKDFDLNKAKIDNFFSKYFDSWEYDLNNGEIMDLEKRLYNLSIIYMILFLMGDCFIEHEKVFLPLAEKLSSVVVEIFQWSVKLSTVPAKLAKIWNLSSWRNFVSSVDESIRISSDLLQLISRLDGGNGIVREMICNKIPEELMHSVVVDFILAAGDTTATSLQWTLYLLGMNEIVQDQIFRELKDERDFKKMILLKNTIKESMRLYPVAPFITRYLPNDVRLKQYTIKAGELISMSMYTCGRSEQYFSEANEFNPSRWIRSRKSGQYELVADPYATLPYGLGSRACIGQKMSHIQLMMSVKKIISMYKLRTLNKVGVKLNLITVPSEPVRLHLQRRP